jgi:biotin-dependent carboxylase-like uncharacterized protein
LRRANRLVGNADGAAALEITVGGLVVSADADLVVAVVGAPWTVDGTPVDRADGVLVPGGAQVAVGSTTGSYAYLALAGGLDVPPVLGSRSSDTLSGLGPLPVRPDDVLPVGRAADAPQPAAVQPIAALPDDGPLRVVPGPRDDWFTDDTMHVLLHTAWTVTPASDRTGLRLSGPTLTRRIPDELPSEGMVAGAIQVPPDGQPIVFLANHPTTGGYPVIAVIVSTDVGRAAQHRPGQQLRFRSG